ncbi:MAG: sigma-70 family RNA polymerase sigma factor [Chloroflexota bacterium]|nr:sigma-70 family RNA polymerase sigma factor [Chloroflexota bacterium]
MTDEPAVPDDAQLIAAIAQRRDPDALARLYDLYGGLAYGLALRILVDPGAAEEAVQEGFFNVWRNASQYTADRGSVRGWVASIVHHQAIDRLRRLRSRRLDASLELTEESGQRPDVWGEVVASLERQSIDRALSALPQDQRKTIELAYFGGYSQSQIADLLRVPLGTVKGRLRLGMDKLRAAMADSNLELRTD